MDAVDAVISQWQQERPDLDLGAMATFGRLGRLAALASAAIEAVPLAHGLTLGEADVLWCLRRSGPPFILTPSAIDHVLSSS